MMARLIIRAWALIGVKARYISYWSSTVGVLGFLKEVGHATATGSVADTGLWWEFKHGDLKEMGSREVVA